MCGVVLVGSLVVDVFCVWFATRRAKLVFSGVLVVFVVCGLRVCWLLCMFISCCPARMVQVLACGVLPVWWWFENSRACFVLLSFDCQSGCGFCLCGGSAREGLIATGFFGRIVRACGRLAVAGFSRGGCWFVCFVCLFLFFFSSHVFWLFMKVFCGGFDSGSGRTLAACLTHASRTGSIKLAWW